MRIVAGEHKGRTLLAPKGRDTRPTSDRTRGAVFNILAHGLEDFDLRGARVLDVFAGTGALGLEALSRGAVEATFMERDQEALKCLEANIAALHEEDRATVLKSDATRPRTAMAPCRLIFLDPPYGKGLVPKALVALAEQGWVAEGTICVAEVGTGEALDLPESFEALDQRRYGAATIHFLRYA
jgi:16S rRNA (guanine966-N2)-methyltransferase